MKRTVALILSWPLKLIMKLRFGKRIKFGKNVILNHKFRFQGKGTLEVGDNCNLYAHEEATRFLTFNKEAKITIGKGTRLNGTTFQCKSSIEIGEDCLIGSAMLIDTDFHSIYHEHRNDPAHIKSKPIKIGDRCWLAGQSTILKGVTVGNESVVAFRALVTKDVPEKVVVAGNPAKVVKEI
ncbi:acyltransferase [Candidatus Peregrinibacteria bacterium]|jgi:acetyltransferase-like isoleucine patch superfamily enzyme|nr:acyltransferase [Candidatus Peregrinibacteria bacterium]